MTPGVTLTVAPPADPVARLVGGAVASRIAAGDHTVWPRVARPGWTDAARAARPLVGAIEALRERFRTDGVHRVVLAATGGIGIAAELLAAELPVAIRLVVLDTTDPAQVSDALAGDLDATVLVLAAPPGEDTTAVELLWDTTAHRFRADGLDADRHTVLVAVPGSPLLDRAGAVTVLFGPPDVDGPWAALTAYALVPAGLAGADVAGLLADAAAARDALARDEPDNPALTLGALLAAAPLVAIAGDDSAEWVEQLLAAGLGKAGHGPLPVVVEAPNAPGWAAAGALTVGASGDAVVHGSAGARLLLWQHAVAVAAHLLGVDPTDRPDAGSGEGHPDGEPAFSDGEVEVHAGPWLPAGTDTLAGAVAALVAAAGTEGADGHLAVHAYLDREGDASAAVLRPELSRRTGLVTTFGWAPRCLPGSGQRDKGGPPGGAIVQVTGAAWPDGDGDGGGDDAVTAPLAGFQRALARSDAAELTRRGRPVLRLHLTDRVVGLVALVRAVQQL